VVARPRSGETLGLARSDDFELVHGRDAGASAGRQAAWYFADELVAVPRRGREPSGFGRQLRAFDDVRRWNEAHADRLPPTWPPLAWIASPHALHDARVDRELTRIESGARVQPLALAPRLASNGAWLDTHSGDFLAARTLFVRGTQRTSSFEARVLWPNDAALGPAPPAALDATIDDVPAALRALVRQDARAYAPFRACTLWQRANVASWQGCTVIALVLNGAQGDDDEAHAGHFAVATGCIADDGGIGDWLVNSLYPLDTGSEKGILAAPTPLSNYQGDVNAGQSWYRPSWLLVAALDGEGAARRVQQAFDRVYRQFWRHQLAYDHATANCTSVSIDTLQAIGLDLPRLGPTSVAAWAAFPALLARERSLAKARTAFDYLVAERTRLLPSLALEAVGEALFRIAREPRSAVGILGREIAREVCGIAWMRIPQFPSTREAGTFPVASLSEYRARLPADKSRLRIVPVPPRPFPEALRDDDLLPALPKPSDLAVRAWTAGPLALLAVALIALG
jgi:hypothetical protein